MKMNTYHLCLFVIAFICLFGLGEGGECCSIQNIITGDVEDDWCKDYCCHSVGRTECCSDISKRASETVRKDVCGAWLEEYMGLGHRFRCDYCGCHRRNLLLQEILLLIRKCFNAIVTKQMIITDVIAAVLFSNILREKKTLFKECF
ncbi:uncharacterized protein LOC134276315 isoform X2 [Saccostrea cucullata]|uniref:uncharacterized protein LOC134276315 isoform X2 n=1 Tax=Saccostrea cuccullata TaxID=36930 RepID=UPI002ED4DC1F